MANTVIRVKHNDGGVGLLLKLYAKNGNAILNGASGDALIEESVNKGTYEAVVTEALGGIHEARITDPFDNTVSHYITEPLSDTTGVFWCHDVLPSYLSSFTSAIYPYPVVERSPADTNPITFSWPASGAAITATVSIDNASYASASGAVAFLRTVDSKHYYTIAYHAADRPSTEGTARYTLIDGTYTNQLGLRVEGAALVATDILSDGNALNTTGGVLDRVTLVDTTTENTDMVGTSGANTVVPDNSGIASILVDTNDLQTNQGNWATASGFATPTNVTDAQDTVIASGTSAWTTASGADIADAVWDEVLHKSTHNVAQSAGKQLRQVATIVAAEGQVNDASATTTSFNSDLTETIDGFYNDQVLIFTDGPLVGRGEVILSYTGATKSFVFDEALPSVPSSGDSFTILGNHVHTKSQIASAIWDEAASGHLTSGTFGGIIESGSSAWNTATGFSTPTNVTDAQDTIIASGASDWTTATGFATPANVTAAQDTVIASGSDWVTASGFNTVVPDNSGVAAIQVKTDQMNFGVSNQLDANVKSINDATINGSGTTGNKWRGA